METGEAIDVTAEAVTAEAVAAEAVAVAV
jgi:hypothetical protein